MKKLSEDKISEVQKRILSYYKKQGRSLPWRKTKDPYAILISEIMLQQTQVDRVKDYYQRWLAKWPKINDLAKAKREEVLSIWTGLGYNSRAINLHKTAIKIVNEFNNNIKEALKHYKELPGIGPYTSQAVLIFAFNENTVTVDTNIRRILIHEFKLSENITDKELWKIAEQCLPKGKSRNWHNALMDYGSQVLTVKRTGIKPKTQQSKFEGSTRQLRGIFLKYFLHHGKEAKSLNTLHQLVQDKAAKEKVQLVLDKMSKEDILIKEKNRYILKR